MSNNNTITLLESVIPQFYEDNEITEFNGSPDKQFDYFGVFQILKKYNLSWSDLNNFMVDGEGDQGIDFFAILINGEPITTNEDFESIDFSSSTTIQVIIGQCKNKTSMEEVVFDKLHTAMSRILDFEYTNLSELFNSKLTNIIELFRVIWKKGIGKSSVLNFNYYYLTKKADNGCTPQMMQKKTDLVNYTLDNCTGVSSELDFKVISSTELLELYRKTNQSIITLEFTDKIDPTQRSDGTYGYLGLVSLLDYYKFIIDSEGEINESILEGNVRHFQGQNECNEKILETLSVDSEKDFWWFNNGITIIASSVTPNIPKGLNLTDPLIVNGLQTTFVLKEYIDSLNFSEGISEQTLKDRHVLIKVMIVPEKSLVNKIIRSTNSQTSVQPAQLRATDKIQINIEEGLERLGYYYDRRKGFYKNHHKPLAKIISLPLLGQCVHAIVNRSPHQSRSNPTSLLKNNATYEKIYKETTSFTAYLNSFLIYQKISDYIGSDSMKFQGIENFKFHLCLVGCIGRLGKTFTADDLGNFDISLWTNEYSIEIGDKLKILLEQYFSLPDNYEKNIITEAKGSDFTNYLLANFT